MVLTVQITVSKHAANTDETKLLLLDHPCYKLEVEAQGKYSRKAELCDIASLVVNNNDDGTNENVVLENSDLLKQWVDRYQTKCFPEYLSLDHRLPNKCWIKDTKNYCSLFKDYGWKPIKLNLSSKAVDVQESWTKPVTLEEFPLDQSTSLESILIAQGDKEVVCTLKKSKLAGHPLALALMKSDSEVSTEFRGLETIVWSLGRNQEAGVVDDETGDVVWTDKRSLQTLLHDKPLPEKKGAGATRTAKVVALESYLKVRVYYKASFSGSVSTDHGEPFKGKRYWNWPLKYLLEYNDIPNAALIYEDVELHFFSEVVVTMDNKDWIWKKNEEGRWYKEKVAEAV